MSNIRNGGGPGPYKGLRVLDLTHVIAGPFCTRLLADLGADVVKVESPGGDIMRRLPIEYEPDMSSAFAQYNCGKRSLGLDLKRPEGLEVAQRLVEWADVVAENLRPGALDRLGLSWEEIHRINPRTVLLSISLFGREGPYAQISGHGATAEAYSGLMSLTGEEGGSPSHFGTPLADMSAGVHALASLGAALFRRAETGEGSLVDVSSFDCLFTMIDQAVGQAEFTNGEREYGRYGVKHPQTVPSGILTTGGGDYCTFSAVGDQVWADFAQAMGRPELAEDPRFRDMEARIANRAELYRIIDDWAATFPSAEALVSYLHSHGLPSARIRSVAENVNDPHLLFRGTLQPVDFGPAGTHLVQSAPYWISGAAIGPSSGPPRPGEHTDDVLGQILNLSDTDIVRLRAAGAVF